MPITRDLNAEKAALKTFSDLNGRTPDFKDPVDKARFYALAYKSDLPETEKQSMDIPTWERLTGNKLSSDQNISTMKDSINPTNADANSLYGNMVGAGNDLKQLDGSKKEFMSALQNVVRTKSDINKEALGTSQMYSDAGIGGIGALSQSLSARYSELADKSTAFKNFITDMKGLYSDRVTAASTAYQQAQELYKIAADKIQKSSDETKSLALELLKTGADLPESMRALLGDKFDVYKNIAQEIKESEIRKEKAAKGIFESDTIPGGYTGKTVDNNGITFDIGSYATDPNHEAAIKSLLQKIGKMNSVSDIDAYIQRVAPGSKVTGQMIADASSKYQIPWEIQMAIMQQDSNFGTAGKGARTFNPGNVGNTDSGAEVNYGDWQSGVNAVAENLSKRVIKGDQLTDNLSAESKAVYENPQLLQNYTNTQKGKILNELAASGVDMSRMALKSLTAGQTDKIAQYDDLTSISKTASEVFASAGKDIKTGPLSQYTNKLREATGTVSNKYIDFKSLIANMNSTLLNLRSGAAVTPSEFERLSALIPSMGDQENVVSRKLQQFNEQLQSAKDNYIKRATEGTFNITKDTGGYDIKADTSKQNEIKPSQADVDYVNSLNLPK